jgi:hypothetical protein
MPQYSMSEGPATERPAPPEIRSILESECFTKTPSLRTLLSYLWDHRDEPISEYAIATEALGRSTLFDSKTDATVRVQISRLRQRLEKYYEHEGQERTDRVVIPLGSHQVHLEPGPPRHSEAAGDGAMAGGGSAQAQWLIPALAAACLVLLLCCGTLAVLLLHRASPTKDEKLPQLWSSFFGNRLPTRIVLPTPIFYGYDCPTGNVILRDTDINDFVRGLDAPRIQKLDQLLGNPTLNQSYTVTSDTFAAVTLIRYLDQFGVHTTVHSSDDAVLEALDTENAIAIGTPGTLTPFAIYMNQLDFSLINHETTVEDRTKANEPAILSRVAEAEGRSIWPGIIAVLPARNPHVHLLILAGRYTAALVAFLTSRYGLDGLQQMWRANKSPEFYQAVIAADMDGNQLVKVWPVALRPYLARKAE